MGYRVLGKTEDVFQGFEPRAGLEGPFAFSNGQVLYYDPVEGAYWDPRTDFYLAADDVESLHGTLINQLKNQ